MSSIMKATLAKQDDTDNSITYVYPVSDADAIKYDDTKTVKQKIEELGSINTDALENDINNLKDLVGIDPNSLLSLECLGDSFVDYCSGMCWSSQGFAADSAYFYVYRTSNGDKSAAGNACGHLQKINRITLNTESEIDYYKQSYSELGINYTSDITPADASDYATYEYGTFNYGFEHGNDMTIITIDNVNYLLVAAGNTISTKIIKACSKIYLVDINTFDILDIINLKVQEPEVLNPVYRIAAVKGTNTVYLSGGSLLYKTTFSYDGTSLTHGELELIDNVIIKGNQGMDYNNGYIYSVDARSRALHIVDISNGVDKVIKIEYIMQGYIMAEPESAVVFGDDIYIVGGTNLNDAAGLSQTLICHGNLKNQVKSYSEKANVRNLDQPIALYAGQPFVTNNNLIKIVESSEDPATYTTGSNYVNYYKKKADNSGYEKYIWTTSDDASVWAKDGEVDEISEDSNITDDGSYDFCYRNGYASKPFNSVYTALLAAKSLYLLGYGTQFNIHINIPINKNITIYGNGFMVTLTSDIQYAFPAKADAKLTLKNFNGVSNISITKVAVSNSILNCTGTVEDFEVSNGSIVYTNSTRNFSLPVNNGIIVANNKIFSRNGIYSMECDKYGNGYNYIKDLYKVFKKVGVIGDSLAAGYIRGSGRRNLDYSWPHCIGRDANTEWLVFGQSGQTTESWLHNRGTNMPDDQGYGLNQLKNTNNKCQMYIIALGQNDADMSLIDMPLGDIINAEYDLPTENNPTPHNPKVSSFYCYYYNIIMEIKNVNPEAIIICLTNPNAYSYRRKQMNAAIRNIVDKKFNDIKDYTVMVLDLETDYAAAFTGLADPQDIDNSYGQTKYDDPDYAYVFNNNKNFIANEAVRFLDKNENGEYNFPYWDHYTVIGYRSIATIMEEAINNLIFAYPNRFKDLHTIEYDTEAGSEDPVTS